MKPHDNRPGNGASAAADLGLGARVDKMNENAQELFTQAETAVKDIVEAVDLSGRVQRHPYGMVAAAIGVGYLLGGGLFTPFTGRVIRLGLRLAALPLVKDELLGMAEVVVDGLSQKGPPGAGASKP
jgi:hypothetical protein